MTVKHLTEVELQLLRAFEVDMECLEESVGYLPCSFADEMKLAAARALAGLKRREGESYEVWAARLAREASKVDDS